ncbi:MAG: hypothetical protein H6812_10405 [Phycisphaeraceae bacterium]|nr:hypothetical protein [Phycisphaerales bacterium]MCB9843658.1 hypothetical protein [Phycisphaeraceae bacterium]
MDGWMMLDVYREDRERERRWNLNTLSHSSSPSLSAATLGSSGTTPRPYHPTKESKIELFLFSLIPPIWFFGYAALYWFTARRVLESEFAVLILPMTFLGGVVWLASGLGTFLVFAMGLNWTVRTIAALAVCTTLAFNAPMFVGPCLAMFGVMYIASHFVRTPKDDAEWLRLPVDLCGSVALTTQGLRAAKRGLRAWYRGSKCLWLRRMRRSR